MTVRVALFGRAADQAGEREILLEVPEGATVREVAERLVERYPPLDWLTAIARPARNLEYVSWSEPASEGDEISFIQPVSGG